MVLGGWVGMNSYTTSEPETNSYMTSSVDASATEARSTEVDLVWYFESDEGGTPDDCSGSKLPVAFMRKTILLLVLVLVLLRTLPFLMLLQSGAWSSIGRSATPFMGGTVFNNSAARAFPRVV